MKTKTTFNQDGTVTVNDVTISKREWAKSILPPKRKKCKTPSEKMIERLRNENGFDFSDQVKIVPTGASRQWRGSGMWQWVIKDPLRSHSLGSDSGIRELLKFKYLIVSFYEGGRILGYDEMP